MYDGLLMVIKDVWEERTVVKDWRNARKSLTTAVRYLLTKYCRKLPWRLSTTSQAALESTSHFINTASGWASQLAFRKSKR